MEPMIPEHNGQNANVWESLYEQAITEPNVQLRRRRLQEAGAAVLERALVLDREPGDHEAEGLALEDAAEFIREMKRVTQTDGLGKEIKIGDKEDLPAKGPVPAKDTSRSAGKT
jgi:hypothetical protein